MASLSDPDIEKLFSGAPQFFARAEGHYTGAPHPSVAFPWDEELPIRDLTDHAQIEHEAWGCITAWPHITRDIRRGPCRERPNMLSMQGLEKGTMGYQAALELSVSDALKDEQWGFWSVGSKDRVIVEARQMALTSKDGLRRLDETTVMDHLIKNAQRYQQKHSRDKATYHELFQELFTHILYQPDRTHTDPYSLPVQIMALLRVLAAPNVWVDFSHVEWRIRLGQVLWETQEEADDSVNDGTPITDAEDAQGLHEERYWLLLQILLACELLVRMDAITEGDELPLDVKRSDIYRFEKEANSSVKWSLHLARVWLDNIEITKTKPPEDDTHETPKGWLANLTHKMTLTGEREGLYHFIMTTLIENDTAAMTRLGPMANLCGGFVYGGKSFWSTACIVGRVLAAGKGAVECMGWISSDVLPQGLGDGWLNINVEDVPEDVKHTDRQARLWGKMAIERESSILGASADEDSILPADFIIPYESTYKVPPPTISVELQALKLSAPVDSVQTTPAREAGTPFSDVTTPSEIKTYTPTISFNVTTWETFEDQQYTFGMAKDIHFVTAHPCVPSHQVKILNAPSSPTIQHFDISGPPGSGSAKPASHVKVMCHPLHKYYTYTSIHLSELLTKSTWSIEQLLADSATNIAPPSILPPTSSLDRAPRVLVIDAMTNFKPQPPAHEIPFSPITSSRPSWDWGSHSRNSSLSSASGGGPGTDPLASPQAQKDRTNGHKGAAEQAMHSETRRRQFGSDMEILVRAICAERGWNALISRRRRGCLACAIREAGALGWRVVIRVD
ncbi:hypothetical protein VPNG_02840 [Cytospora leucostoma]|uniref:Uncharacterized protein n=1 Tax=Cytospora leucostoma TaxID=1230097 RepID=A0A423XJU2_9PEZI|nr:hypothetical protein VPNG_02840 [Cytospora leucostoma]